MTKEEAKSFLIDISHNLGNMGVEYLTEEDGEKMRDAVEVLEQQPIDKSAMMYEIYMKGVNMTREYQGCWVRFKDIEKIVDKYMAKSEDKE